MKTCDECGLEYDDNFHICPLCYANAVKERKIKVEKEMIEKELKKVDIEIDNCSERLLFFETGLMEAKKKKVELIKKRYPEVWRYYRNRCPRGCCYSVGYFIDENKMDKSGDRTKVQTEKLADEEILGLDTLKDYDSW